MLNTQVSPNPQFPKKTLELSGLGFGWALAIGAWGFYFYFPAIFFFNTSSIMPYFFASSAVMK